MKFKTGAAFALLANVVHASRSGDFLDVVWTSPSVGDVFGPGDTIIGKWLSSRPVTSPFFHICAFDGSQGGVSDDATTSNCGLSIWPKIKNAAGMNLVYLTVPEVDSESEYYLRMEDDFGKVSVSPVFSLASNVEATPSANPFVLPPSDLAPTAVQVPFSKPSTSSNASAVLSPVSPLPQTSTSLTPSISITTDVRHPPPVAALAVPISIVGAIILVAGLVALQHHRRQSLERQIDAAKLAGIYCSGNSSLYSSQQDDLERMLWYGPTKEQLESMRLGPMPVRSCISRGSRPSIRESTRHAFPYPPYLHSPRMSNRSLSIRTDYNDPEVNANVNHSVISDYFHPSPISPSRHSSLSIPEPLYVRQEGTRLPNPYTYEGKDDLSSPVDERPKDVYEAVACVVAR